MRSHRENAPARCDALTFRVFRVVFFWSFLISAQHAAENVNKLLIGNKSDMKNEKVVETERGSALAAEYDINFFECSAKTNVNVTEAVSERDESTE